MEHTCTLVFESKVQTPRIDIWREIFRREAKLGGSVLDGTLSSGRYVLGIHRGFADRYSRENRYAHAEPRDEYHHTRPRSFSNELRAPSMGLGGKQNGAGDSRAHRPYILEGDNP
jgi:hypothetical protein